MCQMIEGFLSYLRLEVDESNKTGGRTEKGDRTREIGNGRSHGIHKTHAVSLKKTTTRFFYINPFKG